MGEKDGDMKKAVILCILFSVLLLSGCKGGQEEIQEFPDTPTPEYDAQNQYLLMNLMNFQETEDFFCGTDSGGMQLRYYDKKSGVSGVLCPDPACTHDTKDCGANISTGASLSVYDGKLYWIAPKGEREAALYRSDLSGANREALRTIDPQNVINAYQPQRYMIHRGFLFLVGQADVVEGTENRIQISLLSAPLEGQADFTVLYQEQFASGVNWDVRFVGNSVYFSRISFPESLAFFDVAISRYDMSAKNWEQVYEEQDIKENIGHMWVTERGEIYLPGAGGGKAYVWQIQEGQRKEKLSWEDAENNIPDLLDGIVMTISLKDNIRWVKVMDDIGKTLYEGKLFPQPVPGLEGDPGVYGDPQAQGPEYGFALVGGDSQKLIIQVSTYMENMVDYTLMLDLTDNLKPTVLWSNES